MKYLYVIIILSLVIVGCDNAAINPTIAKARSEQRQEDIMKEQNQILERIATALEEK